MRNRAARFLIIWISVWSIEVDDFEQSFGSQLFLPYSERVGVLIGDFAAFNRLAGLSYNLVAGALSSQEANWDLFMKFFPELRGSADDVFVQEIVSHSFWSVRDGAGIGALDYTQVFKVGPFVQGVGAVAIITDNAEETGLERSPLTHS